MKVRLNAHKRIMITGSNPLTAVHVARYVEIVDREALISDLKENTKSESGKLSYKLSYLSPSNCVDDV